MSDTMKVNLCSGGMDSYLAWKLFARGAWNVYVRIGHRYQSDELSALQRLSRYDTAFGYVELTGPQIGKLETPSGIIPCRNALIAVTAAAWAGSQPGTKAVNLLLGALHGEINSDKSEAFCQATAAVLNVSWLPQYWTEGVTFSVTSPLRKWTKADLIRMYERQGHKVEWLGKTRSCYEPGHRDDFRHCGQCTACFKRWVAFRAAGIADPTEYVKDPKKWQGAADARRKAEDGTYDSRRAQETLAALGAK